MQVHAHDHTHDHTQVNTQLHTQLHTRVHAQVQTKYTLRYTGVCSTYAGSTSGTHSGAYSVTYTHTVDVPAFDWCILYRCVNVDSLTCTLCFQVTRGPSTFSTKVPPRGSDVIRMCLYETPLDAKPVFLLFPGRQIWIATDKCRRELIGQWSQRTT